MIYTILSILAGCASPGSADGRTKPPILPTEEVAAVDLPMSGPTDVLPREDGSLCVLDGYAGRILCYPASGQGEPVTFATNLPRAVRMAPASGGGMWLTVPGRADESGQLIRLDATGAVVDMFVPTTEAGDALHPVDVEEQGGSLVIADRLAGVYWVDGTTHKATAQLTKTKNDAELRRVVDLATNPAGGGLLAVDTLAPRVVSIAADHTADAGFGHQGLAVGRMGRPTGVQPLAGGMLVSDSVLGAVQAFDYNGDLIGALGTGEDVMRFGHPMAVRAAGGGSLIAVLDAYPARLHLLKVTSPLPEAPPPTLVRTELVAATASASGDGGDTCLQCHDGLMNDSREVWDPARKAHPRDFAPETPLPKFFPTDKDGKLVCATCHSPHGVVDATKPADDAAPLVRHHSDSSPFSRVGEEGDALCLACHTADAHVSSGSATLDAAAQGHPTGAGLAAALEARAKQVVDGEPVEPTKASCLSCHAMHGATGDHIMRDPGDGKTCVGCHPSKGEVDRNHPLGRVPGKDLTSAREAGHVVLSADGGVGCLSCHDLTGSRTTKLLRSLDGNKPICLDCHSERTDLRGSPHASLSRGGMPTCISCHDIHGAKQENHFVATEPTTVGDPRGCLACHGSGGRAARSGVQPGRTGHPVDGRTMKTASASGETTLNCLACHDPHAADKPRSKDCATCHAEQDKAEHDGGHGKAVCLDCHPAHSAVPASPVKDNPATQRCLGCHAPGTRNPDAPKLAAWDHPAPMFLPDGTRWKPLASLALFASDGKQMAGGENGDLSCRTCHSFHGPEAGSKGNLLKSGDWRDACGACHADDTLVYIQYFHRPDRRADLTGKAQ